MAEQPRIAYFVTLFPKVSESFVLNEVRGLEDLGVDIVAVCFDSAHRLEQTRHAEAARLRERVVYLKDGFPWRHLRALGFWLVRRPVGLARLVVANLRHPAPRGESRLGRLALSLSAASEVRRRDVTHVHAHWSYPCDAAILIAPLTGVTVSFSAHAHDIFEDIPLYESRGFAFEQRLRAATFAVTCTEVNQAHLRSLVPTALAGRIEHAYHGLDPSLYTAEAPPDRDVRTILSIGRFVAYKGFDVIVRACERLDRPGGRIRCLLVGPEGSQTQLIRDQVQAAGLDDVVEILGPRSQEELIALYREADVYVNASNPDGEYGVANVIVEAMASGRPVIATERPQTSEYLKDGVNALLVPYGDDEALASAINRLRADPSLRRRLTAAARETVEEQFDSAETACRLRDLLLDKRQPPLESAPATQGVPSCVS